MGPELTQYPSPTILQASRTDMLTTDLAVRFDPIYGPISKRFHENPQEFADAVREGMVHS